MLNRASPRSPATCPERRRGDLAVITRIEIPRKLTSQQEKLLREQGEKMSDDDRSTVDEHLSALKAALGTDDLEAIGKATETLMTSSQEFTQKLYEQAAAAESAAAGGGAGAGATSSEPDDAEVVDAEIVDDEEA